jgi:hypothetical protein
MTVLATRRPHSLPIRYVEVCASYQFLFAADLRERGAQLMIGLNAVLGSWE